MVQFGDRIWIFDAKYKGHFEDLDEHRWKELAEELQNEHRRDIHQILAYAATCNAKHITTVLVYPMKHSHWEQLASLGRSLTRAEVSGINRTVQIVLAGVPLRAPNQSQMQELITSWNALSSEACR